MIARIWRGATRAADAERYTAYLFETGIAGYRATPGNAGALVLRRPAGDRAEFTILSLWEDEASIRRFAGDDPGRAVFYPADDAFLVEREMRVDHWEAAPEAPPGARVGRVAWRPAKEVGRLGARRGRRGLRPGRSPDDRDLSA